MVHTERYRRPAGAECRGKGRARAPRGDRRPAGRRTPTVPAKIPIATVRSTPMPAEGNPTLDGLPAAQSRRLIEFERADAISPMIYPPRIMLVVTGRKPWANMVVSLEPLTYIRQPEYW